MVQGEMRSKRFEVPVYMLHITSATMLSNLRQKPRGRRGRRRRRRKVYSGANAVNEEDPERDRATQV